MCILIRVPGERSAGARRSRGTPAAPAASARRVSIFLNSTTFHPRGPTRGCAPRARRRVLLYAYPSADFNTRPKRRAKLASTIQVRNPFATCTYSHAPRRSPTETPLRAFRFNPRLPPPPDAQAPSWRPARSRKKHRRGGDGKVAGRGGACGKDRGLILPACYFTSFFSSSFTRLASQSRVRA